MTQRKMSKDRLTIVLRDCRVRLRIGVYPHEKRIPQPILINLEIETKVTHRFEKRADNSLLKTLNYEGVHDFLKNELPKGGPIGLLETAAELIAEYCFKDTKVLAVRIRLEKTKVFSDASGVGIELTRVKKK